MRKATVLFVLGVIGIIGCEANNPNLGDKEAPTNQLQVDSTWWYASVTDEVSVQHVFAVSPQGYTYCGPISENPMVDRNTGCSAYPASVNVEPLSYEAIVERYNTAQINLNEEFGIIDNGDGTMTTRSALTFQPGITGSDCYGPIGPRYLVSCDTAEDGDLWYNPATGELEVYVGRFSVVTHLDVDGNCHLVPIVDPCPVSPNGHEQECAINPEALTPAAVGYCRELVECESNTDCTDADACTVNTCNLVTGWCESESLVCDDENDCTVDTCDSVTGCDFDTEAMDGLACDDGDACTMNDMCIVGLCEAEPKSDIDDLNDCTLDACDIEGVVTHVPQPSLICDDGDACTLQDACSVAGLCVGIDVDTDDDNPCTLDACDSANGAVSHDPMATGSLCELPDGNGVCTADAICTLDFCTFTAQEIEAGVTVKGLCVEVEQTTGPAILTHRICTLIPGTQVGLWADEEECGPLGAVMECRDVQGCTMCAPGYCDTEAACSDTFDNDADGLADCLDPDCVADPACVPDCTADGECDDGDACTADTCTAGVCSSGPLCTTGVCQDLGGGDATCVQCLIDANCDDGNGATIDTCVNMTCVYTPTPAPTYPLFAACMASPVKEMWIGGTPTTDPTAATSCCYTAPWCVADPAGPVGCTGWNDEGVYCAPEN